MSHRIESKVSIIYFFLMQHNYSLCVNGSQPPFYTQYAPLFKCFVVPPLFFIPSPFKSPTQANSQSTNQISSNQPKPLKA